MEELILGGLCEFEMKPGILHQAEPSAFYRIMLPLDSIFEHNQLCVRRALSGQGGDLWLQHHARLEKIVDAARRVRRRLFRKSWEAGPQAAP